MELQPFDPWPIVWRALFDPVAIIIAFVLGRLADQWQKVIIGAFAAALVGYIVLWFTTYVGLFPIKGVGAATGVFILQFLFGLIWASIGYVFFPARTSARSTVD